MQAGKQLGCKTLEIRLDYNEHVFQTELITQHSAAPAARLSAPDVHACLQHWGVLISLGPHLSETGTSVSWLGGRGEEGRGGAHDAQRTLGPVSASFPLNFEKTVSSLIKFLFSNKCSFLFPECMHTFLKPANRVILYTWIFIIVVKNAGPEATVPECIYRTCIVTVPTSQGHRED